MLCNSLFLTFLKNNGLKNYKDISTRDVICIDFGFGTRSYDEEYSHIKKMLQSAEESGNDEKITKMKDLLAKTIKNKSKFKKISKENLRILMYENGIDVTYKGFGDDSDEKIHYKMLERNASHAKVGTVIFINSELYDKAYNWLSMGIKLPKKKAKIVEMSAYMPLTTSTIVGTVHIPVQDILILKDYDSFYKTVADVIKPKKGDNGKMMCYVSREDTEVKNTLWDGMALIESSILPGYCNGMALLRNHFFKACAFKTNIQLFFHDYCDKHGIDYETYQITDMFGYRHYLKDIKMITTDNAIKWKKFISLMGNSPTEAYGYWCEKVRTDGEEWGIVKTDHPSKLSYIGNYNRMSYQMLNTLPTTYEDVGKIASTSIKYVEDMKNNNDIYEKFLRENATAVNHYEMLADLYKQNKEFARSVMWKRDKADIIRHYVNNLRKGKIFVRGDNLTLCGNPYALLLYSMGEAPENDKTLLHEDGTIQCYTKQFEDGEYLCAFRSPQNSANNIAYFHNHYSPEMEKYFDFSKNIIAVNCIGTDIQPRMNGSTIGASCAETHF